MKQSSLSCLVNVSINSHLYLYFWYEINLFMMYSLTKSILLHLTVSDPTQVTPCSIYPSVSVLFISDLFYLAECFPDSSILPQVAEFPSFNGWSMSRFLYPFFFHQQTLISRYLYVYVCHTFSSILHQQTFKLFPHLGESEKRWQRTWKHRYL